MIFVVDVIFMILTITFAAGAAQWYTGERFVTQQ